MSDRIGTEQLLACLLQGTPDRVLDSVAAMNPDDAIELAALRDTLAALAFSAPVAKPSDALRARILASRPRPRKPRKPVFAVLDMINDHLTAGRPMEVPRALAVVPAIGRRLAEARALGMPIIYLCDAHDPSDPELLEWPSHAIEGTDGGDVWPDLAPQPGDHVVHKSTYSAFTGSELAPLLDRLGADEIILTGCATEVGLLATATDALQRGFVVTVPPDAQAGGSEIAEQLTLMTLAMMPPYHPRYLRAASPDG